MIQVIVFYSLKETAADAFISAFKELSTVVLSEEGCLQYELFVSPYSALRFCLVEKWNSQAELDKHLKTKHLADFREQGETWFTRKPLIEIKTIENERYL